MNILWYQIKMYVKLNMEMIIMHNFTLQFHQNKPMYIQLYEYIKTNILNNNLKYNDKLPSKRRLSTHLNISKNTVETAYDQLLLEGYIISKERKGYFVNKTDSFMKERKVSKSIVQSKKSSLKYDFDMERIALDLFPYSTWTRIHKQVMLEKNDLLYPGNGLGDDDLRTELVSFLYEYRGIHTTADQIIIGAGIEYLISLLAQLLNEYELYIEYDYSHKMYQILKNQNLHIKHFHLTQIESLKLNKKSILYLTSSHQFPFGNPISLNHRSNLTKWLNDKNAFIIEDDYNYEFTYNTKPLPALYSLNSEKVIYLSTFSRSIAPGLRIAFMILPPYLLSLYKQRYAVYSNPVSRLEQQTLYRFIHDGFYSRLLNRLRNHYKNIKKELIDYIKETGNFIEVYNSDGGLFLTLMLHTEQMDEYLNNLLNNGIRLYRVKDNLVYMGYGSYSIEELKNAIDLMYKLK